MLSSILILFSSTLILFLRNPIHCLLSLILSFLNLSILLLLHGLEFLALSYIVVYVGAICVLFLFVILLLNLRIYNLRNNHSLRFLLLFLFFSLIASLTFTYLSHSPHQEWINPLMFANLSRDLYLLGESFFFFYFHHFFLSILLLLLGILTVISISLEVFQVRPKILDSISHDYFKFFTSPEKP